MVKVNYLNRQSLEKYYIDCKPVKNHLPFQMNQAEQFQSFCRKYINQQVKDHFSDIEDIEDTLLKNSVARQAAKLACLHRNKDPIALTVGRILVFYFVCQNYKGTPVYGTPVTTFDESFVYRPHVILHFRELTKDAKANDRYPIRSQVAFRLDGETLTENEAKNLAKKIRDTFATPTRFYYTKGRTKISYRDKKRGYENVLTVKDEQEAREVITKIHSLRGHVPDFELLSNSESGRNYSKTESIVALGQAYEKPKRRPIGKVYFTHAELKIHGMPHDKTLVAAVRGYPNAYYYSFNSPQN